MSECAFPLTLCVLGTSQNSGKTVTCIGLLCKLLAPPYSFRLDEIGYMKPVGQRLVQVRASDGRMIEAERDAALVTALMGVRNPRYDLVSPIVWTPGRTGLCIDDACCRGPREMQADYLRVLQQAYAELARGKKAVIVEGTGQIGVGSVGGVSAADIVLALREWGVPTCVLLVTQGDLGASVAETVPHLLTLARFGVRIDGLIVNRVDSTRLAESKAALATFYGRALPKLFGGHCGLERGVPIVGVVPEIPDLALPTMRFVQEHLAALPGANLQLYAWPRQPEPEGVFARRTVALSLRERYLPLLRDGDLVVTGINANPRILSLLDHHRSMQAAGGAGLAGILLSCQSVGGMLPETRVALASARVPVLATSLDTARTIHALADMTVKIQPYDAGKRDLIAGAYCRHTDDLSTLVPEGEPFPRAAAGAGASPSSAPPCTCPACQRAAVQALAQAASWPSEP